MSSGFHAVAAQGPYRWLAGGTSRRERSDAELTTQIRITYVQTVDGWVSTATVIDLHSRKVVGSAVADHLRTSLIIEALAAALVTRRPPAGVIFHSDRGCQGGLNRSSQHLS